MNINNFRKSGKKVFIVNFALLAISCIICLYSIEVILLIKNQADKNIKPLHEKAAGNKQELNPKIIERINIAQSKGIPYDMRSKYEVLTDLRQRGIDAYPSSFPATLISSDGLSYRGSKIFPLGSISNKITVHCNESGEYLIFKSDEHGFNNPIGLYGKGTIDIVLIGDSFVQGNCVSPDENIAGWLRKADKNSLSLRISASGPLIELAILKEYAEPLKPKFVFWFYYEVNDLYNLTLEKTSVSLMNYLKDDFSQNLIFKQKQIDAALTAYIERKIAERQINKQDEKDINSVDSPLILNILKLQQLQAHLRKIASKRHKKLDRQQNISLFENILRKAKNRVNEWGGELFFVYLPSGRRYEIKADNSYLDRGRVLSIVKQMDIPIIDIHKTFTNQSDIHMLFNYGVLFGHYNPKGYKLIAKEIISRLKKPRSKK